MNKFLAAAVIVLAARAAAPGREPAPPAESKVSVHLALSAEQYDPATPSQASLKCVVRNDAAQAVRVPTAYDGSSALLMSGNLTLYRQTEGKGDAPSALVEPGNEQVVFELPLDDILQAAGKAGSAWRWDWPRRLAPPLSPLVKQRGEGFVDRIAFTAKLKVGDTEATSEEAVLKVKAAALRGGEKPEEAVGDKPKAKGLSLVTEADAWQGKPYVKVFLLNPGGAALELLDDGEPPFSLEFLCAVKVDGDDAFVRSSGDTAGAEKTSKKELVSKTFLGVLAFDQAVADHFGPYTPVVRLLKADPAKGASTAVPLPPGKHSLEIRARTGGAVRFPRGGRSRRRGSGDPDSKGPRRNNLVNSRMPHKPDAPAKGYDFLRWRVRLVC